MIDIRLMTFMKLCETLNYHKTAELMHLTQPAISQHIKALEAEYECSLLNYDGRKLSLTTEGKILRQYARSAFCNEQDLRDSLSNSEHIHLRIGATRTIGAYVCGDILSSFLTNNNASAAVCVDNTDNLLNRLNNNEIDFAMVEGYFDKQKYDWQLMRMERFVGICSLEHPFAMRTDRENIPVNEIMKETLIAREEGSGTRSVLEQVLREHNRAVEGFRRVVCVNDFLLLNQLVSDGTGISFVYESVARSSRGVAVFGLQGHDIKREFDYVYLKNTNMDKKVYKFLGQIEE